MIRVSQTLFGNGEGNCFSACVASILELPLSDVPNFCQEEEWRRAVIEFLKPYSLGFLTIQFELSQARESWVPEGYCILSGKSPRGDFRHSVVGYAGEMVFDPHPDGAGLDGGPDECDFLVSLDPSFNLRAHREAVS